MITFNNKKNLYLVLITPDYKEEFQTMEEAIEAFNKKAKELGLLPFMYY